VCVFGVCLLAKFLATNTHILELAGCRSREICRNYLSLSMAVCVCECVCGVCVSVCVCV